MTSSAESRLAVWRRLVEPGAAALLEAVADVDVRDTATMARLRRRWDRDELACAIELLDARRRAVGRFPHPERLVADGAGLQQATSQVVAVYKAARFRDAGCAEVVDLCCGIGGDAMALARVATVTAVDRDLVRAWMAGRNAGVTVRVEDVTTMPPPEVFHLDPARRDEQGGGRRHRYEDYQPGPAFIAAALARATAAAVKLGPGVDLDELPGDGAREIEIINERGTLVQAILWHGATARHPGQRTATRIGEDGSSVSFSDVADEAAMASADLAALVHTIDPAIERAGLTSSLAATLGVGGPHPRLGLLTSDEPLESPWVESFLVHEVMPWRPDRVRAWLAAHDAGIVEVKTRGGAVNPDVVQRDLRGRGSITFTVFVLRFDRRIRALITQRSRQIRSGPTCA